MRLTPSMQQYMQLKKAYADCILLFQMGDFYETFFEDAKLISRVLGIILTSREKNNPIPMAGFPIKALDTHLPKLINAGYKVAIAQQIEDPKQAKGLVQRKVTEIVTPGSLTTDEVIGKKQTNIIASLYTNQKQIAIATADLLGDTITLYTFNYDLDKLQQILKQLNPQEIIIPTKMSQLLRIASNIAPTTPLEQEFLNDSKRTIQQHFNVPNLLSLGIDTKVQYYSIGQLLKYIEYLKGTIPKSLTQLKIATTNSTMYLDYTTLRNLDILPDFRSTPKAKTLLETIDRTITPMGYRFLYQQLKEPLLDINELKKRQKIIAKFLELPTSTLHEIQEYLSGISDLQRIVGLIGLGKIKPRQALSVKKSLINYINLITLTKDIFPTFKDTSQKASKIIDLISYYLREDCSNTFGDGPIINEENFAKLARLRRLTTHTQDLINEQIQQIKTKYKIEKLKLGYNKIYGYYFEIPKTQGKKLPESFIRKQTLVHSERFITPELKQLEDELTTAHEKIIQLEIGIYQTFKSALLKHLSSLIKIYNNIAYIDFLFAGALLAQKHNYVMPKLLPADKHITRIQQGRHPVVEQSIEQFIANDVHLTKDKYFALITGPNMGGKSTFIRQVALIQILAQIGYFVPGQQADLSIKTKIFARIGANDNLTEQMSTFMMEMSEMANIIKNIDNTSLVILDEVGRGTSSQDGLALAQAISEYLITESKAHILFATHFYELTDLDKKYKNVINLKVEVYENNGDVIFLHTISPGKANKSYGIHIAKLVNLPKEILKRAEHLVQLYETNHKTPKTHTQQYNSNNPIQQKQPTLFSLEYNSRAQKILEKIKEMKLENMTPLEALNFLNELKNDLIK